MKFFAVSPFLSVAIISPPLLYEEHFSVKCSFLPLPSLALFLFIYLSLYLSPLSLSFILSLSSLKNFIVAFLATINSAE